MKKAAIKLPFLFYAKIEDLGYLDTSLCYRYRSHESEWENYELIPT